MELDPENPYRKAGHGGTCLESQPCRLRDRQMSEADRPVSHAYLEICRPVRDPIANGNPNQNIR